ncbi:MAG: NAD(P)H-dependent glycerol-3-phosphate dehydrogenase [Alphaproteobacteria bacterium]
MNTTNLGVIGTGSWGSALAHIMAEKELSVTLWARREEVASEINTTHKNTAHLGDIPLNRTIKATTDLQKAVTNHDILLMVTPAQAMRSILELMKPYIHGNHTLVLCSKGIEQNTLMMMSEIVEEIIPATQTAILSGPNFAKEIAKGKPAATTLASKSQETAETLQKAIASPFFRPYATTDIIGTQIAGALKNVIAIACGIAKGLDMGESARASLVTRGLAEISRLGIAMGAKPDTFLGLSGVGDMMLTCSSEQSRNFSTGLALAQGKTLQDIMKHSNSVAEGVHTAKSTVSLAKKYNVDMPICTNIDACINKNLSIENVLESIINRPLGQETRS